MTMAAVAQPCFPGPVDPKERYPLVMSPLQLEVWDSRALGAVAGNAMIAILFCAFWHAVGLVAGCVGKKVFPAFFAELDAQGFTKFPAVPIVVFVVLYQGTTMGSMDLVLNPDHWEMGVIGITGIAFTTGVPCLIYSSITANIPDHGYVAIDPTAVARGQLFCFFLGKHEWVSRSPHLHWVGRWSTAIRTYASQAPWFLFIELAAAFTISAINSIETADFTGCGHVKAASGLVFLILLGIEIYVWPHLYVRNNMFDLMLLSGQAVSMGALAYGYYSEDLGNGAFTLGANVLMYCMGVLGVRVVLDVINLAYVLFGGRRTRLQYIQFKRHGLLPMVEDTQSVLLVGELPAPLSATEASSVDSDSSDGDDGSGSLPVTPLLPASASLQGSRLHPTSSALHLTSGRSAANVRSPRRSRGNGMISPTVARAMAARRLQSLPSDNALLQTSVSTEMETLATPQTSVVTRPLDQVAPTARMSSTSLLAHSSRLLSPTSPLYPQGGKPRRTYLNTSDAAQPAGGDGATVPRGRGRLREFPGPNQSTATTSLDASTSTMRSSRVAVQAIEI